MQQARSQPRPAPEPPVRDQQTLEATRVKVRELLDRSPAFGQLPDDERRNIAHQMVRVASYMANPDGVLKEASDAQQAGPLAQQQARPSERGVRDASRRASGDHGFAGEDFEGGAIRQGTEQFGELVGKVDFPQFVGGLIENVFQAIVTSSIQQMRAYAEMLKSVSQSVDDFARDNITENNARDWLADTYPDLFDVSTSGGDDFGFGGGFGEGGGEVQPRLVTKGDAPETGLRTVSTDLMLETPITDISEPESEAALVRGARMAMAKSRMQLLASMVVLGINRIVVTDGSIRAKVIFGMRASDVARRRSKASLYDKQTSSNRNVSAVGFGFLGIGGGSVNVNQQSHMTTVGSSLDESSSSQAELKAQLSGDVRVNFKSDFLPAEKLATPEMMAAIQGNARPQQPPRLAQPAPRAPQTGTDTAPAGGTPASS
jgi:hypothetical protein